MTAKRQDSSALLHVCSLGLLSAIKHPEPALALKDAVLHTSPTYLSTAVDHVLGGRQDGGMETVITVGGAVEDPFFVGWCR